MIGGIAGRADFQVRTNGGNGFPVGLLSEVAEIPGVEDAAPEAPLG